MNFQQIRTVNHKYCQVPGGVLVVLETLKAGASHID